MSLLPRQSHFRISEHEACYRVPNKNVIGLVDRKEASTDRALACQEMFNSIDWCLDYITEHQLHVFREIRRVNVANPFREQLVALELSRRWHKLLPHL